MQFYQLEVCVYNATTDKQHFVFLKGWLKTKSKIISGIWKNYNFKIITSMYYITKI